MRSTKKRRKLVNLPTYYKRIFPLLFAWMILLTTCAGSQSDVLGIEAQTLANCYMALDHDLDREEAGSAAPVRETL